MIKYTYSNNDLSAEDKVNETSSSVTFLYPCDTPYECSFFTIQLERGLYLLEAWGASGATGIGNQGKCGVECASAWRTGGGYSKGVLNVPKSTELFLYLGGSPNNGEDSGGYNGGGPTSANSDRSSSGGGGATDFRTVKGDKWDNEQSLYSRILVAGGSGGSHEPQWGRGGYGGGENASDSLNEGANRGHFASYGASGANQMAPGKAYYSYCSDGTFGSGGIGYDGGGGGGGWYGGAGGALGIGGSGGSSFAYNHQIKESLPWQHNVEDEYQLTQTDLRRGDSCFVSAVSNYECGHFGHGVARITIIRNIFVKVSCKESTHKASIITLLFISLFNK